MKISQFIDRVTRETDKPDAYAFLPEIQETLQVMKKNIDASVERREQLARGLERYVLEDNGFSESTLGGELLELSEAFVTGNCAR